MSSSESETEYGQFAVHHLEGHDGDVANLEGLVRTYLVQLDGRHARIAVLSKAIRQHLQQSFLGYRVSIDVDFTKLAIGAQVVHASHVVIVGMGNEHTINLTEGLWHDLLTEVGTAVNEQSGALRL